MDTIEFWKATEPFELGQCSIDTGTVLALVNNIAYIPCFEEIVEIDTNGRVMSAICQSCKTMRIV